MFRSRVLVLAVVYLIAGVLVMKFVKGAHGSELVPNVGFWKGLPLYVKVCNITNTIIHMKL